MVQIGVSPDQKKARRDGLLAVIVLVATFLPVNFIHESGHWMACAIQGYSPTMKINGVTAYSSVNCEGIGQGNILIYRLSGGLLTAGLFALTPLFLRHRYILISFIPIALAQLVNAILEGFAYHYYITNVYQMPTILINGMLLVSMLYYMKMLCSRSCLNG